MHKTERWSATICIPAQREAPGSGQQEVVVQTYKYALRIQSGAVADLTALLTLYNNSVAAQPCLIDAYVSLFSSALLATSRSPGLFPNIMGWIEDYIVWATCCNKATVAVAVVIGNFFIDFAKTPGLCSDFLESAQEYLNLIDAKCNNVAFVIECPD